MENRSHIWIARALLAGLIAFGAYYPYTFLRTMIPLAFSGPESWQFLWIVDDTALAPLGARLFHFSMWVPTVLATQGMILAAIWLVGLLLRGIYFETRTVRALQWVGGLAAVAGATALVSMSFEAWVLTAYNSGERAPIRFHFESGEIGVLLTGLGLFLLGWVLRVTVIMRRENQEIV